MTCLLAAANLPHAIVDHPFLDDSQRRRALPLVIRPSKPSPDCCKVAGKSIGYTSRMIRLRLISSAFFVDIQLREINGRWIASADTPDGPSLGLGERAIDAIEGAPAPFEGIVEELMASVPRSELGNSVTHPRSRCWPWWSPGAAAPIEPVASET